MSTPADEIHAAAEQLGQLVTSLGDNRGPWYIVNREQRQYPQRIDNIGVPYVVASTTTDPSHPPTIADYIITMNPRVGAPLVDMLTQAAEALTGVDVPDDEPALRLARAINATAPAVGEQPHA